MTVPPRGSAYGSTVRKLPGRMNQGNLRSGCFLGDRRRQPGSQTPHRSILGEIACCSIHDDKPQLYVGWYDLDGFSFINCMPLDSTEIVGPWRRFRNGNQSAQYELDGGCWLARDENTGDGSIARWAGAICLGVCSTGRSRSYGPIRQASRDGHKARGTSMINALCNRPAVVMTMVGSAHDYLTTVEKKVEAGVVPWVCSRAPSDGTASRQASKQASKQAGASPSQPHHRARVR